MHVSMLFVPDVEEIVPSISLTGFKAKLFV